MARRMLITSFLIFSVIAGIALWNYLSVHRPASQAISSDPRNKGISVFVHYKQFVNPDVLVFDLREVSPTNSATDVTRTLLQTASSLKSNKVESVILSYKGKPKFMLKGGFFHTLGIEYGTQNPVYTLRTLPENVYKLDGRQAFATWTGGLLGVTGKQMEDLSEFHKQWFISDL